MIIKELSYFSSLIETDHIEKQLQSFRVQASRDVDYHSGEYDPFTESFQYSYTDQYTGEIVEVRDSFVESFAREVPDHEYK